MRLVWIRHWSAPLLTSNVVGSGSEISGAGAASVVSLLVGRLRRKAYHTRYTTPTTATCRGRKIVRLVAASRACVSRSMATGTEAERNTMTTTNAANSTARSCHLVEYLRSAAKMIGVVTSQIPQFL